MIWYLTIMATIVILIFSFGIYTEKFKDREKDDPKLQAKMEVWRKKWNPRFVFFDNLAMWVFIFFLILFVYLR